MASYLDLQDRIASETRRTDVAELIRQAILDAIKHYKDDCFWNNQTTTTEATVVGQREYDVPTDFSSLIQLDITANGITVPLISIPFQELDEIYYDQSPATDGVPTHYALFGDQVHIGRPADVTAYTLTWHYVSNLAPPENDADAGFWMNEAERMIRCYAKGIIYSDVLMKNDWAEAELKKANDEYNRLVIRSEARAYDPGVRAYT